MYFSTQINRLGFFTNKNFNVESTLSLHIHDFSAYLRRTWHILRRERGKCIVLGTFRTFLVSAVRWLSNISFLAFEWAARARCWEMTPRRLMLFVHKCVSIGAWLISHVFVYALNSRAPPANIARAITILLCALFAASTLELYVCVYWRSLIQWRSFASATGPVLNEIYKFPIKQKLSV